MVCKKINLLLTISNVNHFATLWLLLFKSRYKNISIRAFFRAKKINYHPHIILSSGSNGMGAFIFSRASCSFDEEKKKKSGRDFPISHGARSRGEIDRKIFTDSWTERGEAPRYTEKSKISFNLCMRDQ